MNAEDASKYPRLNEDGEIEVSIKAAIVANMREFAKKENPAMLAIQGQELLQRHLRLYEELWLQTDLQTMSQEALRAEVESARDKFRFAVEMYNVCFIAYSLESIDGPKMHQKRMAARGAKAKNANSPKQAAKVGARALWEEWRTGMHQNLRTTEQFATEVQRRWPVLTSAKNICAWSAEWNKEIRGKKPPAC